MIEVLLVHDNRLPAKMTRAMVPLRTLACPTRFGAGPELAHANQAQARLLSNGRGCDRKYDQHATLRYAILELDGVMIELDRIAERWYGKSTKPADG